MLSKILEETLHRALAHANGRQHELATLGHLLLSLTEDQDSVAVLRACNVDGDKLRHALESFLDEELGGLTVDQAVTDAKPTPSFQRVIQRAVHHVQMSGREEVTGANVLVAIFSERESHAVYFLHEQEMTRLDAVSYISHGIAKAAGASESRTPTGAADEEDGEKPAKQGTEALDAYCVNLNKKAPRLSRTGPSPSPATPSSIWAVNASLTKSSSNLFHTPSAPQRSTPSSSTTPVMKSTRILRQKPGGRAMREATRRGPLP